MPACTMRRGISRRRFGALSVLIIFCICIKSIAASPLLEIRDYQECVDFTGKKIVLIQKGDRIEFKEPEYNDSDWDIVSLPSNWLLLYPGWHAVCWYRLHIKFPDRLPDKSLGIRLGIISDVDEVFFNGCLIGRSGRFPPNRKSAYDKKRIYEIPTIAVVPGMENVIAIRVAGLFDYEMGPIKGKFQIAPLQDLQRNYIFSELLDIFFVITYLAIGIYFIIISVEKEYLFFSLLTLSTAVYLFLRTQIKYLIFHDFLALKRLEYLILFIILFLVMEFTTFFFKRRHFILHYIYYGITAISLSLILVKNDARFWNQVLFYVAEPSWSIPFLYCSYVSIKDYKKEIDAKYIFIAFLILWIIFINDVLVDRGIYNFIKLSYYAFWIIIVGIAFMMRKRYLRLRNEVADLRIKESWKTSISDDTKEKLEKIIEYLKENFTSDISREGLAGAFEMNPDYLGKVFKIYTGKKISEYINELRIRKAAEMILADDASIADIAFSNGFESLSTFYRLFHKIMGESPKSYQDRFSTKNKDIPRRSGSG